MGKINYLLMSLVIGIVLVSCQKDDNTPVSTKGATASGQSSGATIGNNNGNGNGINNSNNSNGSSVTPQIIAGANNGGNRTCAEVGSAFMNDAEYFDFCGEKIDYTDGGFKGQFPEGLDVSTDGKYVSFEADQCIRIGDKFYTVSAVIVKGSNAANVYFYPDGTLGDSGLSAPVNASGKPAGLSNLSFCFVECSNLNLVIAFKSYMTQDWACTSGGPGNISFVGYYNFIPDHDGYKIYFTAYTNPSTADITKPVGNLKISDIDNDGLLEVTVDNSYRTDLLFTDAYLFVGTLEDYNLSYFTGFPYKTGVITPVPSITFELPF